MPLLDQVGLFVVPDGFATTLDKHRLFHLRETGSKVSH